MSYAPLSLRFSTYLCSTSAITTTAIGLVYEEPDSYGRQKIDLENPRMEESANEAYASEQENLLHRPSSRVQSSQSLRRHLTTAPIIYLFSAGFLITIGLPISLLVMVHTYSSRHTGPQAPASTHEPPLPYTHVTPKDGLKQHLL